jgi:hypothetical protein
MMPQEEKETQKARAKRFRERLTYLKSDKAKEEPGSTQESPHDFVQRRMRENARKQQGTNTSKEG